MFRNLITIFTVIIFTFVLLINPVYAESISINFNQDNNTIFNHDKLSKNNALLSNISFIKNTVTSAIDKVENATEATVSTIGNLARTTANTVVTIAGTTVNTAENVIRIVRAGGTIICITGDLVGTAFFPPAAMLLPYCSAIEILNRL